MKLTTISVNHSRKKMRGIKGCRDIDGEEKTQCKRIS